MSRLQGKKYGFSQHLWSASDLCPSNWRLWFQVTSLDGAEMLLIVKMTRKWSLQFVEYKTSQAHRNKESSLLLKETKLQVVKEYERLLYPVQWLLGHNCGVVFIVMKSSNKCLYLLLAILLVYVVVHTHTHVSVYISIWSINSSNRPSVENEKKTE